MRCCTARGNELYVAIRGEHGPSLHSSPLGNLQTWKEASLPRGVKHCEALFTFDEQVFAFLEFADHPNKMQVWRLNQRRHLEMQSWRFITDAPGATRNFAVLVADNVVLKAGGVNEDAKSSYSVHGFDLSQPEEKRGWTQWPSLPKSLACGRLLLHAGRLVYTGGWNCKDGSSIRLSMKAYSTNLRLKKKIPTNWDEHCLSPLPLSQSGMAMLGPCAVSVGGCPLSEAPKPSEVSMPDDDSLEDSGLSESDDSSTSLSDGICQPPSIPVAVPSGTRPDPQEDMPQRDVFYCKDTGERGVWLKFPSLQFACSEPCLIYSKGTLLCFAGKDKEGVRTTQIQSLLLHY